VTASCPNCGENFKSLGAHWAHSPTCDYPTLPDRKREIVTGLLMGDASVEDRGSAGRLTIEVTNQEFIDWIDDELGSISLGVESYQSSSEQTERVDKIGSQTVKEHHTFNQTFELKTRSHPLFKSLYSWYDSGSKRFPENLELTPLKAKMWYCCDGSLVWSDDQRPHARIYTENESGRLDVLTSYFHEHGIDAREYAGAVGFTADGTEELLDWMGEPPNGMQYKWV